MGERVNISDLSVFGLHIRPREGLRRIYIAGPMSNGDLCLRVRRAIEVGDYLLARGFVPYIPHQSIVWQLIAPKDHTAWLEYDIEWLKMCDGLLRLPGPSVGADYEVEVALSLDKHVYYLAAEENYAYADR